MKTLLKRLIIDSATKNLYISLYEGTYELCFFFEEGHNDHSIKLMSEIERMFAQVGWKVADLDEIIIGIGPGSYTGLRIGVVVAKMFSWNNHIPVKTVSSLALMASSYDGDKWVLPEIDARRGNSFLGVYKNDGKSLTLVANEELTNLEEYKQKLRQEYVVVSEGKPNIAKILGSKLLVEVADIHGLNPNYLRKTEAEQNLEK